MKKLLILTTILSGLLTQAATNAAEPARRSLKAPTQLRQVTQRVKVSTATVSVKAPVTLRNDVVRFTSQLQKLSPKKQAAFVAAVKRAYSLRKDAARQEALKGAIAKYGGSTLLRKAIHVPLEGEDEPPCGPKIKIKITFKPLAIEITFEK